MAAQRLKVMQLLPALGEGGVERGTLELAHHLSALGHRSMVVSGGGRLVGSLLESGSQHLELGIGRKHPTALLLVARLRRLFRELEPDIVHARSRLPAWLAHLALRGLPAAARPAFVTTVHGLYSVNAYSAIMTRGDRVIAVSDTVRRYIAENYPAADPARVTLIYRGVSSSEFPHGHRPSEAWRQQWYASYPELRDKFVLVMAGRMRRLKGHHDFLRVAEMVRAEEAGVHALIVGDDAKAGAYQAELERAARRTALPVTFTGHRGDIREVYAASSVVLSLSVQPESFGRSVLEPLCLGVPVVGYAHGGVGEILARMFPQGGVPVGDLRAAAERVTRFVREPCPVPAENPFPLSTMLERTVALYEELASPARRRAR